jgi:2-phospho-L-lactate guanylyltransferase
MSTVAVIPDTRLGRALRRLSRVLEPDDRRALQVAMLEDVLSACRAAERLDGIVVVTEDLDAAMLAQDLGAAAVPDHSPPRGMNAAVEIGVETVDEHGADAALILVSDIPLASGPAIDAVIDSATGGRGAVLVPSRDGTGTNALLVEPPRALAPQLGPDSRAKHLALAGERDLQLTEIEIPELALDVDTAKDLADLANSANSGRAAELTRARGLVDSSRSL